MSNPRPEATLDVEEAVLTPEKPRVLILDLSVDPALYRPLEHWGELLGPVPWRSVRVFPPAGETPAAAPGLSPAGEDLGSFTHIIVTGSEASIVEPQPWFEPAEDLVRSTVAAGLPVLGSCFGHQLVIRALCGPAHVRRAAQPELGWFPLEVHARSSPFHDLPLALRMFSCHFDEVCDLPGAWEVCARSRGCGVHFYRHRERPIWGIQAHPEIDPKAGAALLRGFLAQRPEIRPLVDDALSGPVMDDGFGVTLLRRFLRLCS